MAIAAQRHEARGSAGSLPNSVPALSDLALRAPESVVQAAIGILKITIEDEAKAPFVARALYALTHLTEQATNRSLLDAAGAQSDSQVLLRALEHPSALDALGDEAPLFEARVRGALAQRRLLEQEGGVCSAEEFGRQLGLLTRQAVDVRRKKGKLIGLDIGRHGYQYPVWQIHEGKILPGLEQVLVALHDADPWTQMAFMLSPNSWLSGETPLVELRRGAVDRVVATAEMVAE